MKVKVILAVFGCLFGALLFGVVYLILAPSTKRVVFNDVNDFRRSIVSEDAQKRRWDGENFASIVNSHPDDSIIYDLKPGLDVTFILLFT